MPGQAPSLVSTSLWHTPQACTLMRTCPASGLGISRSTISKSAPGLGICAAFIGATAILVVAMISPVLLLSRYFEDEFQLHWRSKRKARNAIHQAAWVPGFSEDAFEQLRSAVCHLRLIADISGRCHSHAEPDDPRHFVERPQVLPCDCKRVERGKVSSLAACFHIELRANTAHKLRAAAL